MESGDLRIVLELSFEKSDWQKNQIMNLWLTENKIVEYFCRIGVNLRLR